MVVAGAGSVGEGGRDVVLLAARVSSRRAGDSASAESSSLSGTVPSSSSSDEARPLLRPPRPSLSPRPRPRARFRPPRPPRATTAAHRPPPRPAPRSPPTKPPHPRPRPPRLLLGEAASAAAGVASSRPCNAASSLASGELELAAGWPSASCSRRRISRAHHSRPTPEGVGRCRGRPEGAFGAVCCRPGQGVERHSVGNRLTLQGGLHEGRCLGGLVADRPLLKDAPLALLPATRVR